MHNLRYLGRETLLYSQTLYKETVFVVMSLFQSHNITKTSVLSWISCWQPSYHQVVIHYVLLERQWRLQKCSSVPGHRGPEGQRDRLCCSTNQPRMADSAAQHHHQAGQSRSPE